MLQFKVSAKDYTPNLRRQIRAVAQDRRRLMKAGAYVRTVARRKIRKRKSVSNVNQPPSGHTGALKNSIMFALAQRGVMIGPTLFSPGPPIPGALEHGGLSSRKVFTWSKGRKSQAGRKNMVVRKRPFMAPAKDDAMPGVLKMWENSIK